MTGLINVLHTGVTVLGAGGLLYSTTVTLTTIVAVFGRTETRRRDARATLGILLRRQSTPQADDFTGRTSRN
jgi:hypothetical protein